jgi:hypothetical protein
METITADDPLAGQACRLPSPRKAHHWPRRVSPGQADPRHLEQELPPLGRPGRQPSSDQVSRHLALAVHRNAAAGHELLEIDAVRAARKAQLDTPVLDTLQRQPLSEAGRAQGVHGRLLQHSGSDAAFHVRAVVPLEHAGVDALAPEEVREQEARRARPDDRYARR